MEEHKRVVVKQQILSPNSNHRAPGSSSIDLADANANSSDLMTKFTNDVKKVNSNNNNGLPSNGNQRRPRGRYGRGLAKKNGAGGHFTWGSEGDQMRNDGMDPSYDNSDPMDPNYDSDSEENCKFEAITPPLDDDEVEKFLKPILLDYFEHGQSNEVLSSIREVNISGNYYRIVIVLVSLALDRKSSHRELASILISDLYGSLLKSEDIERGFNLLLNQLDDLELDTPDASTVLGNFIARCIADDCIPPKYVTTAKESLEKKRQLQQQQAGASGSSGNCELSNAERRALNSLTYANSLIHAKRGLIKLDSIWGLTGGARPVKYLIKQMRLIIKEYLSSLDAKEVERCLRELEVPHFYHEFVFETILAAIDGKPDKIEAKANLLKALSDINLISVDQMKKGFLRLFNEMPEIHIDVPHAYASLEKFMQICFAIKLFLPRDVVASIPTRGRKRFISEGDGGRIKE